jgi:undecaprenyl-diphosphatase
MNIFHVVILGIVEGLTEFLPVSSTFHLIFASKILQIPSTDFQKLFEVFIQSGAILSVVFLYFNEMKKDYETWKKIIVSFLPTAVIGLALYKVIKNVFFESPNLMLFVFVAMGVVFIGVELLIKVEKKPAFVKVTAGERSLSLQKNIKDITYVQAFLIGVFQALAVIPGVSRAGAVLVFMIILGYKRKEAAKYSFLLAVPTIFAASALDLWKMKYLLVGNGLDRSLQLGIGFLVSFAVSYFVIRWFIGFLQKNTLLPFGVYRLIAGIGLFFLR